MKHQKTENNTIFKDKNYQMAVFISLLIGIQGFIMAILALKNDSNIFVFSISMSYSILMFISFFITIIKKNLKLFYVTASLMVLLLELNFLKHGGTEGFGIIWMSLIPLFSVYLFTFKSFFFINSLYFIILILAFWTPLNKYIYAFKPSFSLRFPIVYALGFIFGAFLKYRITKTENALEKQTDILEREIQMAASIQKSFLKQADSQFDGWSIFYRLIPQSGVSGDFFDIYHSDYSLLGTGIFDISGHGISSGLITMLAKNIIQSEFLSPLNADKPLSKILENVNRRFIQDKGDIQNYLTGILVRTNSSSIEYVNAGHPSPILYHKKSNTFEILLNSPEAIGVIGMTGFDYSYISMTENMETGDELILYTDGLIEAIDKEKKPFGEDNLLKALKHAVDLPADVQISHIFNTIQEYTGDAPATDDMTLLILQKN